MRVYELTPEQRKDHRVLRDNDGDYLRYGIGCSSYTHDIELAEAWPDHTAEHIARALNELIGDWTVMPIPEPERPELKTWESRYDLGREVVEKFLLSDGRCFTIQYDKPRPDPLRDAAGEAIQVCRLLIALNRYEAGIQWSDIIAGANRVLARIDEKTPAGS